MAPIPELEAIRRAQILAAAQAVMAARGCANVTMADIAEAAGMSKGGLAHYYKSKHALFKAVLTTFFDRIFERSRKHMASFGDPMEKLLSFVWLYDGGDPDLDVGYPILFDFMSIAVHDSQFREIFHDWIDNWVVLLRSAIEEGLARGVFAGVDPEPTARVLSAVYQGIATRWYLDPDAHDSAWAVDGLTRAVTGLMRPYLTPTRE